MNEQEAYAWALAHPDLGRNDDGTFDEKVALDLMVSQLSIDVGKATRAKAKRFLDRQRRPGWAQADKAEGQLNLFDTYAYEPERLVATDDHTLVEQRRALPQHTAAQAQRVREKANELGRWADRRQTEAAGHAQWALTEVAAGRLTPNQAWFDTWVRSTGVWTP